MRLINYRQIVFFPQTIKWIENTMRLKPPEGELALVAE